MTEYSRSEAMDDDFVPGFTIVVDVVLDDAAGEDRWGWVVFCPFGQEHAANVFRTNDEAWVAAARWCTWRYAMNVTGADWDDPSTHPWPYDSRWRCGYP